MSKNIYSNKFLREIGSLRLTLEEDDDGIVNAEALEKLRVNKCTLACNDMFMDFSVFMKNPSCSLLSAILLD